MFPIVSVDTMRKSDAYTIEHLVPSLELMYRAALGVYAAGKWDGKISIVVGSGNNGGDGFALGCILKDQNISPTIYTAATKFSGDSSYYRHCACEKGVNIVPYEAGCLTGSDIIVDCLLGTGFSGHVKEPYKEIITEINNSNAYVISVDINSGMNGDTGCCELAVHSDLTVAIGYIKQGQIKAHAGEYIEKLVCADIAIVLISAAFYLQHNIPKWLDTNVIKVSE